MKYDIGCNIMVDKNILEFIEKFKKYKMETNFVNSSTIIDYTDMDTFKYVVQIHNNIFACLHIYDRYTNKFYHYGNHFDVCDANKNPIFCSNQNKELKRTLQNKQIRSRNDFINYLLEIGLTSIDELVSSEI